MSQATVSFHLPAPPLRPAISTYYVLGIAGPGDVEDIIHPEWANIRLILSGQWRAKLAGQAWQPVPPAAMSGPLERGALVHGSPGQMVGVGILPEGWVRLTGQPASAFANRIRPLSDALGAGSNTLLPALRAAPYEDDAVGVLDRYFTGCLAERPEVRDLLRSMHALLVDAATHSVEGWADEVGVTTRQLERLCLRYFGLAPKRLLRRQRFLRTLAAMRDAAPGSWSGLIDAHYVDQAHFIREFRYFLGMSPSAYFARPQPFMRQAGDRRKALLGAPVQGLHEPAPARQRQAAPGEAPAEARVLHGPRAR